MLGNLFEDRNWLLPKIYLAIESKIESATGVTSLRPPLKEEPKIDRQVISPKEETHGWAQIALFVNPKRRKKTSSSRRWHQMCKGLKLKDWMP